MALQLSEPMSEHQKYLSEVCEALTDRRAAFMVGAGISVGRQSWLPSWNKLVYSLLQIIGGPDGMPEVKYITKQHMKLLFNEVFLQRMVQAVGLKRTAEALRICMDTGSYSAIHKFLAWSMQEFDATVFTTNYDELIERASGGKAIPEKFHGTLSNLEKARFTIKQIFAPLDRTVAKSAAPKLEGRTLVVIGYRGTDEFDVVPFLFEQAKPRKFIWVTHSAADGLDPAVKRRLDERRDPYFQTDADKFLRAVYEQIKQYTRADDELDRWQARHHSTRKAWWLPGLQSWGERLKEERRSNVDFLWAQILDYLRIYRLKDDSGVVRRPAEDAYERFLQSKPTPIRAIEASVQLAYIRRTTETIASKDLLVNFQTVIAHIWEELDNAKSDRERSTLQGLLARAYHQFGIALQNVGAHLQAHLTLEKAAHFRRFVGDRERAYTIFQQFMNGREFYRKRLGSVDEFAPRGWRNWLPSWLGKCALLFKESHEPEHYGNTLHNLAFVHQFLAEEHEEAGRFEQACDQFSLSLKLCEGAKGVRERLRDPRMIAQSEVRIAECKLGLARDACRRKKKNLARTLVEEAAKLAGIVDSRYAEMPQETFRREAIVRIRQEAEQLRQQYQNNDSRS